MFESPKRHHHSNGTLNRIPAGERRRGRNAGSARGAGPGLAIGNPDRVHEKKRPRGLRDLACPFADRKSRWTGSPLDAIPRSMSRTILVCGGGGFVGNHLVRRLKAEGDTVVAADLVRPRYGSSPADKFYQGDLCEPEFVSDVFRQSYDEVYQLAADMGGAGYVFVGNNDATIMRNSTRINLNVLDAVRQGGCGRIFFSSSACVYPELLKDALNIGCRESDAYPATPDSDYGWEKLFAERLYAAYGRNHGLAVRIARYHNVFGPEGAWGNGREKAPAAICRKVALATSGEPIEIWGDGQQIRSFLYIDECLEGTLRLMRSDFCGPTNIGSDRTISINELVDLVADIAGKKIARVYTDGPVGVSARCSDNTLIQEQLGWKPGVELRGGLEATYRWIEAELAAGRSDSSSRAA